jgi:ABC-2 type transport system permease protein
VVDALTFRFKPLRGQVLKAMVLRDVGVTRSYRLAFVLDVFFGVLNLAMFFFISRTFANVHGADLHGAPSYFAFASVGIAITIVVDAASTGLAQRIRGEQLAGTLEALLTQPVKLAEVAFGLAAFPFLFAMIRAAFYLVIAGIWFHVDLAQTDWLGFVITLLVAGAAFTALGILLGAVTLVVKRGDVLVGMVIYTMGLISGAFFPVAVLPAWIRPIGRFTPTRFAFDGIRSAVFLGGGWVTDAIALVITTIVGVPIAVWFFGLAVNHAKRNGTLGQY